jgi:hypothetical protein
MLACDLSEPIMPTPVFCGVLDFELIADVFRFLTEGLIPLRWQTTSFGTSWS